MEAQFRQVVVLGMHRSGTSMIGGVLARLGVDMGKELVGKSWSNPLGHFEDKEFFNLNNRILEAAGGAWDSPPSEKAILAQAPNFREEIERLIRRRQALHLWGWKDPRTSLTIRLYMPYLSNPYFLICHRDLEAIAESLKRRDKMDIKAAKRLAEIYEQRIEQFFTKHTGLRRLDLKYEEVTKSPDKWVNQIVDFLEIQLEGKAYQEAVRFVLPNEVTHKLSKRAKLRHQMSLIPKRIKASWKIPGIVLKKIKSRLL